MIEKIKQKFISNLYEAVYKLERVSATAIGNSEEIEDFAYAENTIWTYSELLEEFFPDVNIAEIEQKGKLQFQKDYEEHPENFE